MACRRDYLRGRLAAAAQERRITDKAVCLRAQVRIPLEVGRSARRVSQPLGPSARSRNQLHVHGQDVQLFGGPPDDERALGLPWRNRSVWSMWSVVRLKKGECGWQFELNILLPARSIKTHFVNLLAFKAELSEKNRNDLKMQEARSVRSALRESEKANSPAI